MKSFCGVQGRFFPKRAPGRRRHYVNKEKIFAVTGNPVLHSKSPLMFNRVFERQSIPALYARLAASTAEEAIFLFKQLGLMGMNVTAPFKQDIMQYLDIVEPAAVRIGGVNTVVREKERLKGYNTDYIGVVESLKKNNIPIRDRRCVILGAGGAGRAAAYGLVKEKANVIMVNRTFSTARVVARSFGGKRCKAERIESLEEVLKSADILVSTLAADIDIVPGAWLRRGLVVMDANYKKSILSEKAQNRGCRVIKGEAWLLNQALPAFRYFLGEGADEAAAEIMGKALLTSPPGKPKNIALVGFMGCGKSTAGRILASQMGFDFKDMDELIEAEEGRSIPDIFTAGGEDYFREIEKKLLKTELENHTGVVYACGGGVVIDRENREVLKQNALVTWLYSTIETAVNRILPGTRPLLENGDPKKKALEILNKRMAVYAAAADLIVSSEKPAEQVAEKIHEEIRRTFYD
jgi:shikimate dehydrogenase